mgnify:CR=1 FL=1|jgi:ferredoxin
MKTTLFFYSGTGNALWTAEKIAQRLMPAALEAIARCDEKIVRPATGCIGLVFPVHIWGVPPPVLNFIDRLEVASDQYLFAVAVHAGQVAATLGQLQKRLQTRRILLSSGFSFNLPSNYIPWGGAESSAAQQKKFAAALDKIETVAGAVQRRERLPVEKGPFWQNGILSLFYRLTLPRLAKMDKSFYADEKCSSCGICARICPARNIRLGENRPVWQHRCEQCFACLQWCPEEAIQYGRGTRGRKRYHHPEIPLARMLAGAPAGKDGGRAEAES